LRFDLSVLPLVVDSIRCVYDEYVRL
jgi:hypothetical protein